MVTTLSTPSVLSPESEELDKGWPQGVAASAFPAPLTGAATPPGGLHLLPRPASNVLWDPEKNPAKLTSFWLDFDSASLQLCPILPVCSPNLLPACAPHEHTPRSMGHRAICVGQ